MNNYTDTNQDSEDDQASRMGIHMAMLAKAENAKDAGHATVIKLGFAVSIAEELIRTEKLKLLAEVRERVIGENDRGTITNPDSPSYGEQYESTMADKDDLRAALNELEAEL